MKKALKYALAVFYYLPALPCACLIGAWQGLFHGYARFVNLVKSDCYEG